jgi:hypothetical protein
VELCAWAYCRSYQNKKSMFSPYSLMWTPIFTKNLYYSLWSLSSLRNYISNEWGNISFHPKSKHIHSLFFLENSVMAFVSYMNNDICLVGIVVVMFFRLDTPSDMSAADTPTLGGELKYFLHAIYLKV